MDANAKQAEPLMGWEMNVGSMTDALDTLQAFAQRMSSAIRARFPDARVEWVRDPDTDSIRIRAALGNKNYWHELTRRELALANYDLAEVYSAKMIAMIEREQGIEQGRDKL